MATLTDRKALKAASRGTRRPRFPLRTPLVLRAKARAPASCCRYWTSDLPVVSSSFMKRFQNICKADLQVSCGLIWREMSISLISHCYNLFWENLITVQGVYLFCILEPNNFNEGLSIRYLLLQFIYSSELCKFVQQSWMISPSLNRCLLPVGLCIFAIISPEKLMWKYFYSHRYFGNQHFFTQVCLDVRQMVHINDADWLSPAIKFY